MAKKKQKTFSRILDEGADHGMIPAKTGKARGWYRARAGEVKRKSPKRLMREQKKNLKPTIKGRMMLGNMYLFEYDPKLKKKLPYYDEYPLVFPIQAHSDGFLGINLHYLPHRLRAKLMDSLYGLLRNDKMDESTRLRISYDILKSAARYKYFKPCVKRYLNENVTSRYLKIEPNQWDIAIFLPLERFKKAPEKTVWSESRKKV
jgi:hypothetical protein